MSSSSEPVSALPESLPAPSAGGTVLRGLLWRLAWIAPPVLALPWLVVVRAFPVGPFFPSLAGMLFVLLAVVASTTDLLWRRIYNWATGTTFVWIWVLQLIALVLPDDLRVPDPSFAAWGQGTVPFATLLGVDSLAVQAIGTLVAFGIMFLLSSAFGGSGLGDLKLVTVFGALLGPSRILEALVYAYIIAGIGVACYLLWVIGPRGLLLSLGQSIGLISRDRELDPAWRVQLQAKLPMGPFLSLGAFLAANGLSAQLF
jgi:Flp pilus assembly protein protease CpaA